MKYVNVWWRRGTHQGLYAWRGDDQAESAVAMAASRPHNKEIAASVIVVPATRFPETN